MIGLDLNIDIIYEGRKLFVFREGKRMPQIFIAEGEEDGQEILYGFQEKEIEKEIIAQAEKEQHEYNRANPELSILDIVDKKDIVWFNPLPITF